MPIPLRIVTGIARAIAASAVLLQGATAANLVGQWTFNETAQDATGNGNDVVLVGDPSFVSLGQTNQGLSLNPAFGQYIDYGSSQLFNITGPFTLESWVTLRGLPAGGGEPLIFGKDHTLIGTTFYANGNSYSYVGGGSLVVAVPLALNQPTHLVQTWDGSTIRVYRDGVLAGTFSSSVVPNSNAGNSLLSGRPGPSDGTGFLDAVIDETRIYTGALTASEVNADYVSGPTQIMPQWAAQSGDWNTTSNWIGAIPNGVNSIANFAGSITGPRTVFTDVPVTVGTLRFDNANAYVIAGSSVLSLESSSVPAKVEVVSGNHKISLPLTFVSNCNVTIANGSRLTFGNPTVIKAGKTVTQSGDLRIEAPLIIEAGGSLVVGPGTTTLAGVPSVGATARIDIQVGELVIDYHNQQSPTEQIRTLLASGYHNGAWDGPGICGGFAVGSIGLGWRNAAADETIQIQRARYGDADLSGAVTSIDFGLLVNAYGMRAGATWSDGDFNYDGKVNTLDFNSLAGNFGASLSQPSLGTQVPEPMGISLVCLSLICFPRRRTGK